MLIIMAVVSQICTSTKVKCTSAQCKMLATCNYSLRAEVTFIKTIITCNTAYGPATNANGQQNRSGCLV